MSVGTDWMIVHASSFRTFPNKWRRTAHERALWASILSRSRVSLLLERSVSERRWRPMTDRRCCSRRPPSGGAFSRRPTACSQRQPSLLQCHRLLAESTENLLPRRPTKSWWIHRQQLAQT